MEERLKEDFSIDWEDDRFVSRREFFKFMTLASGGLAAGTAILAAWPAIARRETAPRKKIAMKKDVAVGRAIQFQYPEEGDLCILVHRRDGEFVAFSRRCTHLSCPVQFQADKDRLFCPCHNGAFSLNDGSPTQGPPRRPLDRVEVEVVDGAIYATGVTRG